MGGKPKKYTQSQKTVCDFSRLKVLFLTFIVKYILISCYSHLVCLFNYGVFYLYVQKAKKENSENITKKQ